MVSNMTYRFSANSDKYEKILGKFHKYCVQAKCEELLKTLTKLNCYPKGILELGCGTGEAEENLHRQFIRTVGVDLSRGMISEAKNKNIQNCEFTLSNALKLPFRDNNFDLVFSFCLFHHLQPADWILALKEAKRVLTKGGILVICEHNPENPITVAITKNCPIDKNVTLISSKKLETLCEACGIRILQKKFIIFFPEFLSFLRRMERFLFRIPFGGQYMIIGLVV